MFYDVFIFTCELWGWDKEVCDVNKCFNDIKLYASRHFKNKKQTILHMRLACED